MLIYELHVPIATEQETKIIERADDALELHAVDQEHRNRDLVLAYVI